MSHSVFPRWLIAALVVVLLGLVAGGSWFYHTQERQLRARAEENLLAIAQLKVNQIVAWRNERLGDAEVLSESPFFSQSINRWLADPQPALTDELLVRFQTLQKFYPYSDVLLVDAAGQIRLSLSGQPAPLHPATLQSLALAWQERQPVLTDLHAGDSTQGIHIDVVAPLMAGNAPDAPALGAVILEDEADQFLYPLIQSWPVPSRSAETLLVRRDDDAALFLSNLRFQPNTALTLRIPLNETNIPAVMALEGKTGIVHGEDYRGNEVIAAIEPVPNTDWFMVSKMDASEVYADWRTRSLLILALIPALVAAAGTTGGVLWQRTQKIQYKRLFLSERARQESEARYQATLMSIGDGVIATNVAGEIVLLNPVAETLTGWSQTEACGKPLENVFPIFNEDTHQIVDNPVRRILQEGMTIGLANHTLLRSRAGREIPIADSGAPVRSAQGDLIGVVLVFRDQTDERAAQKALRESERRFSHIFHASPVATMLTRLADTQIVDVNEQLVALMGYTRDELLGHTSVELGFFADPQIRPRLLDILREHGRFKNIENQLRTKSGELLDLLTSADVINLDGEPHVITMHLDITERKQIEAQVRRLNAELEQRVEERTAQLSQSKERIETILNSSPDVLIICRTDGTIEQVNPAFYHTLQYAPNETLDRPLTLVAASGHAASLEQSFAAAVATRSSQRLEITLLTCSGTSFEADGMLSPVVDQDGQLLGVVCSLRDITPYRQLEDQLRQMLQHELELGELKSRYMSMAAHDLRNPLAVIQTGIDLLERYGDRLSSDQRKTNFDRIRHRIEHAVALLDDILTFGQVEAGKLTFNPQPLALETLCQDIVSDARQALGTPRVIEVSFHGDHPTVLLDAKLLRHILTNLLSNALKYSPDESTVSLDTCCEPERVVFTLRDQGIGIPAADQARLFEAFHRASNVGAIPGTGLGLTIVRQSVELHGGTISFTSQQGVGTTFTVILPSKPAPR